MKRDDEGNPIFQEYELPKRLNWRTDKPPDGKLLFLKVKVKNHFVYTKSIHGQMGWDAGGPYYWTEPIAWAEIP